MANRSVVAATLFAGVIGYGGCVVTQSWYPCVHPDENHWVNGTPDPCYYIEPRPVDGGTDATDANGTDADGADGADRDAD